MLTQMKNNPKLKSIIKYVSFNTLLLAIQIKEIRNLMGQTLPKLSFPCTNCVLQIRTTISPDCFSASTYTHVFSLQYIFMSQLNLPASDEKGFLPFAFYKQPPVRTR